MIVWATSAVQSAYSYTFLYWFSFVGHLLTQGMAHHTSSKQVHHDELAMSCDDKLRHLAMISQPCVTRKRNRFEKSHLLELSWQVFKFACETFE